MAPESPTFNRLDFNNSRLSAYLAVVCNEKNCSEMKRFALVEANGVTAFAPRLSRAKAGADDGIRTRDLRFTKPLLYQLSYVGTSGANIAFTGVGDKRSRCSRFAARSVSEVRSFPQTLHEGAYNACAYASRRDAATKAKRKSRQFRVVQCAPDLHRARVGSARSVPAMARN